MCCLNLFTSRAASDGVHIAILSHVRRWKLRTSTWKRSEMGSTIAISQVDRICHTPTGFVPSSFHSPLLGLGIYKKCPESMAPGCSRDRDHVIIVWSTQTNAYGGYQMTGASWWASPVTIWTGPLNWPFLGPPITLSLGFITVPESWHWCFVIISLHCWQLSTSCNWI